MKKNIIYSSAIMLLALAYSCSDLSSDHSVSFKVINKSNSKIEKTKFFIGAIQYSWNGGLLLHGDSIEFSTSIAPNDSATFTWDKPKTYNYDESFFVKINGLRGIVGGYLPNGMIDKYSDKYSIQVFNDSLISKGL
ncbi:MAG TPA: hypothetical protein VIK55_11535 [Paludibacter sp.]